MSKNKEDNSEDLPLAHKLLILVNSSWKAQAIYVAAELKIAELLTDGPKTSKYLANKTGVHAPSLHRLLRALTTIDICKELKDGSFELTSMGKLLKADHPESVRSWIIWWVTNLWQAWGNLLRCVKTGKSARKMLEGIEGFSHLDKDPKEAMVFNQALVELTRLIAKNVVAAYDFSKFETIMDVGGGYGELLSAILKANSRLSGILFDRPHALKGSKKRFEKENLLSRCKFLTGDFFISLPKGADIYVLKSIIHDWNDEKSKQILKNCRSAMGKKGRLLLVERILPKCLNMTPEHQELVRSDLTMLVALGAGERTEDQYRRLLSSTGFKCRRIISLGMTFSLIEAVSI